MIRSLIPFLFLCLLIFGCKNEDKNVYYLQKEDVQLVQPRIIVSNTLIDSFVIVKAELNVDGALIFFTDDGSEPTKNSTQFSKSIEVNKPKELKFKAFHKHFKSSETENIKLYKKGHSVSEIIWFIDANIKYKGSGETTVINGKKASMEYSNPQWLGFDTIAKASVKFDKKTTIKTIDIGYLNDPASWIFPPTEIEIIVNNNIEEILTFQLEPLTGYIDRTMMNFIVPINKEVKTLNITVKNVEKIPNWHDGKGNKAWLFMDEWIFN